jgi:hypothetical protein
VVNGVVTLKPGTYDNITISSSVKGAKIVMNKTVVKGTLTLESGATYTVDATRSTIGEMAIVASSTKSSSKEVLSPSFVAGKGARVENITVQAPVNIERTIGRITSIEVKPAAKENLPIEIKGFIGSLNVTAANNSNVTIGTTDSRIRSASVAGGAVNQSVKFTSDSEDASNIKTVKVNGTVNLTVDVPTTTVAVDKAAKAATVAIDRPVTNLTNAGSSTAFTVSSTIKTVSTTGDKATMEVTKDAKVNSITAGGAGTQITGAGTVTDVKVEGNQVNVNTSGTTVAVDNGVTGTTAGGRTVNSGTSTESPSTPVATPTGGSGGSGGSGSSDNSNDTPTTTKSYTLVGPATSIDITFDNGVVLRVNKSDWDLIGRSPVVNDTISISGIRATMTGAGKVTLFGSSNGKPISGTYSLSFVPGTPATGTEYIFTVTVLSGNKITDVEANQ